MVPSLQKSGKNSTVIQNDYEINTFGYKEERRMKITQTHKQKHSSRNSYHIGEFNSTNIPVTSVKNISSYAFKSAELIMTVTSTTQIS